MSRRAGLAGALLVLALAAADARAGRIGPGVIVTDACTSNFVFRDATDLYLGTAAHCVAGGTPHDCGWVSYELGRPVPIEGATRPGILAYSSWETMQRLKETDVDRCFGNDFALLRIDPADHASVDPSMPQFGGPVGLRRGAITRGETVLSVGRSIHRDAVAPLRPREGYAAGTGMGGWQHGAWFPNPVIPGDSGSGVLDGAGGAFGIATRGGDGQTGGSAGIGDLAMALDYMRTHGGPDARLVSGEPFRGAALPTLVESPPSPPEPPPAPPAPAPAPPAPAQPQPAQQSAPAPKAKRKPARRCRKLRGRRAAKCRRAHGRRR